MSSSSFDGSEKAPELKEYSLENIRNSNEWHFDKQLESIKKNCVTAFHLSAVSGDMKTNCKVCSVASLALLSNSRLSCTSMLYSIVYTLIYDHDRHGFFLQSLRN